MKIQVIDINGKSLGREVELPQEVFGLELSNNHEHVVYLAVKQYLAQQRQGTHKAKERNEISGSTRKLHRQKGTGGSRKGGIKNPLYRGGGRIFGPRPRNYDMKINKKVSRLARIAALSSKAFENRIIVVDDFKFEAPKTKSFINFLSSINTEKGNLSTLKSILLLNPPATPEFPKPPKFPYGIRGRKIAKKEAILNSYNNEVKAYESSLIQYQNEVVAHEDVIDDVFNNIVLSCRNIPNADVIAAKDLNVYQILNSDYLIISESSIQKIKETLIK
jgi:large subunit ribosomal protein L4